MSQNLTQRKQIQTLTATKKVNSTMLSQVSYDSRTLTMFVLFKTYGVYTYMPVYRETFDAICDSETPGSTFNQLVKSDNKIICTKIF